MEHRDYHVRTQFDGKDYLKVFELYYYDDDGNEVLDEAATALAEGGVTCADLGEESLLSIRFQVENALRAAGIQFGQIEVEPSEE